MRPYPLSHRVMDHALISFQLLFKQRSVNLPFYGENLCPVRHPFDFAALFVQRIPSAHSSCLPSFSLALLLSRLYQSATFYMAWPRDVTQHIVYEPHFNTIVWETYARTKRGEEMSRILGTPRTTFVLLAQPGSPEAAFGRGSTLIRQAFFVSMPKDKQFPLLAVRGHLSSIHRRFYQYPCS